MKLQTTDSASDSEPRIQPIRVAQVGVGNYGAFRRHKMRETGLFDLVAAYDIRPEALQNAVKEDGAVPAESFKALLQREDIEAVIISTGAKFHAEQVLAAIDRGLHVFVEKPLCTTSDETRAILAAERNSSVIVSVGHTDLTASAFSLKTKELIDSGQMGKIVSFDSTVAHSGGFLMNSNDWRSDPAANPGGMLFQCGVHAVHELMFYFGPIKSVSALMRYDIHTSKTADAAICQLTFANGMIGTLKAFHVTPYRHSLDLYGTDANLYRNERSYGESTTFLLQKRSKPGVAEPMIEVPLTAENDSSSNLRSFYNAIRHGTSAYPSTREGAQALALVFAAEESAKNGGISVPVPTF